MSPQKAVHGKTDSDPTYDFSSIASEFFTTRFALMTKSEIELALFKVYLGADGNMEKTDFEIGCRLGLTEQRVSSLRYKLALQEGLESVDLLSYLTGKGIEYDEVKEYILVVFSSRFERDYIKSELTHSYDVAVKSPLGSNYLQMTVVQYFAVLVKLLKNNKEVRDQVQKIISRNKDLKKELDKAGSIERLLNRFTSGVVDVSTSAIVSLIITLLQQGISFVQAT